MYEKILKGSYHLPWGQIKELNEDREVKEANIMSTTLNWPTNPGFFLVNFAKQAEFDLLTIKSDPLFDLQMATQLTGVQ